MDTILEMAQLKASGRARKLVVAGCLVERFREQIRKDIPDVDAVVGTGELVKIIGAAGMDSAPWRRIRPSEFWDHVLKAMRERPKADFPARIGMARSPTCRIISMTKPRRASWLLRGTWRTSRLRRVAIILAVSALFRSCAGSSARAALSLSLPKRSGWRGRACGRSHSSARIRPAMAKILA